ncbi:MAG: GNAT family N-acetyltransferase [Bacteroidota bacterium]
MQTLISQAHYRTFCRTEMALPLFLQDWWLDAVCMDGVWQAVLCMDEQEQVLAAMPYFIGQKFKQGAIVKPPLTPYLGPWFRAADPSMKRSKFYGRRDIWIQSMLQSLPRFPFVEMPIHPQSGDWMAFYQAGFEQTTAYTYVLEDLSDLDAVFAQMAGNTRTDIRRAQKQLTVEYSEDIELLHQLLLMTFERQGLVLPVGLSLLQCADEALRQHQQRAFLIARDAQGRIHAGVYMVWDGQKAYNLMSGADTKLRSSGAVQLLLWEAIRLASAKGLSFDFEGSMLATIEPIFRRFGGVRQPYHRLYKYQNRFWKLVQLLRSR